MNDVWQGVLANWLYYTLAALVGIFVGYLKRKKPAWISPFLYGLSAAALASVVVNRVYAFQDS
jgi:hypothetical protein